MTALKSLFFLILVAGLGAAYVPFELLPREPHVETGIFAYLAFPLWLLGTVMILRCFWDFTFRGHGTPAPIDPPKALVTTGFYRYVRNPIYVGVLTLLIGHFLWFKALWMLAYVVVVFLAFHLFVTLYEEPTLKAKFGAAYEQYCKSVPRWVTTIK
jgi:protein-S-isoprenylcysteine O-methyltransferase Ste14